MWGRFILLNDSDYIILFSVILSRLASAPTLVAQVNKNFLRQNKMEINCHSPRFPIKKRQNKIQKHNSYLVAKLSRQMEKNDYDEEEKEEVVVGVLISHKL